MACNLIAEASAWLDRTLPALDWARGWAASVTAFSLVAAAEFGDKSQLVCMALAARHRHWPVLWGAVLAFALLNLMAVAFGAAAGSWLPPNLVALAVAVLFAAFGLRSLLAQEEEEDETVREKTGHGIFVTTFLMIFLAEFGDKTQIAVAGLGAAEPPVPVWLGATLALSATSAIGIWAGRTILQKVPQHIMHRIGGLLFLGFAVFAAFRAMPPEWRETLVREIDPLILRIQAWWSQGRH
jgi:putative Ca2+/H+ antiporter (TMEM165/GDT1 family)